MKNRPLSNKLYWKLSAAFLFILIATAGVYISIATYFTNLYFEETTQRLNSKVTNHLIEEKFQDQSPFFPDGTVNKPLFGDIMHDMMAVNRGIEVYLLDGNGVILYSVVLNHDSPAEPELSVDMQPLREFIAHDGRIFILGDNPRIKGDKRIFSAAHFEYGGQAGYIYIILAGNEYDVVTASLFSSYFIKLGTGAVLVTLFFALAVGLLAFWYLMANLRNIILTVQRFGEGDTMARIEKPESSDLATLAGTFNNMADTINDNIDKLKGHDKLRQELVANVSHDLRTPLAIIQGYTETLLLKEDSLSLDQRQQFLKNINSSADRLARLIAQLFEYSKLEAQQVEPQKEPFLITDLVMDLFSKYQLLAEEKKLRLDVSVNGAMPLVFADIALVERVIQNLLDNALKFTQPGGEISLILNHDKNDVIVTIKDNGPGISEQEQKYIFQRYRKAKSSTKDNFGAGLGLAIVKKILDIHQASISVISKPEQGTAFRFTLPVFGEQYVAQLNVV